MEIIEYLKIKKSGSRKKIVGLGHNVDIGQVEVTDDFHHRWKMRLKMETVNGIQCCRRVPHACGF